MNNTGDDRRVRKTKKALRQGLVALLAQKNLKDISVRELTDAVDLHRGTFYVHYRDIYELYDRMWQEMIEEIREIFRQYPAEELSGKPAPLFRAIMEYAWDNQDLCQMFFGPNVDQALARELTHLVEEKIQTDWAVLFPGTMLAREEYLRAYVVEGCMGMVRRWVDTGMQESPRQMAELLELVITACSKLSVPGEGR
jgi:AcrR family transcriptional regulator